MQAKDFYLFYIIVILLGFLFHGCSDLHQPVPTNPPQVLSVHPSDWLNQGTSDFHGQFLRDTQWDLKGCRQCHGVDYKGGISNTSCLTCHPSSPEDCTVCHGGVDNLTGAPPEDLEGKIATTSKGVGAHSSHLMEGLLRVSIDCEICHVVPDSLYSSGHVDSDLPAEVKFSGLALEDNANPQWNGQICQNTYCHGGFELGNPNNTPIWTKVEGTQAACGTCHGLPPGGSHPAIEQCNLCHSSVVDAGRNIIDKTLHINGMTDFSGSALHPSGWLIKDSPDFHALFIRNSGWDLNQCQQCHGADYAGGIVNVSCLNCHPATPEDCIVCHGGVDNLTGAPPEDIDGNRDTNSRGVGAHTAHLTGGEVSSGFDCGSCHGVPGSFDTPGHVDSGLPAEVNFSHLTLVDNAIPHWNAETVMCQNTYCHGNWSLLKENSNHTFIYSDETMSGNSASTKWTDPATAACGTCHELPPIGHKPRPLPSCGGCHRSVIDAKGIIIDKSKHVNGMVNVFGQEYPIF